jgi:hypothetical protein
MSGLPRRPYSPEPLPPDGLHDVRREAHRRRRVRAIRVSAGGAATVAATAAIVVALTGATGGADVLRPLPPAVGHDRTTTPSPAPALDRHKSSLGPAAGSPTERAGIASAGSTARGGAVVLGDSPSPGADNSAPGRAAAAARPQPQPQLSRYRSTYVDPPGSARLCGNQTYGDAHGVENSFGWCLAALIDKTGSGERLTVQLCRDSTSGGRLSYTGSREVDLTVRQGSSVVWRWSRSHPGRPDAHTLSAPKNGCWNWSLVWPDINQHGASAGHGTFTFVARTTASELGAQPTQSLRFDY